MTPASASGRRVVLLDLDGTLVDSAPGIVRCIALTLQHYGIEAPPEAQLRRAVGPPIPETMQRLTGFGPEATADAVAHYRGVYLEQGIALSSVFPGVRGMLDTLRSEGVRVAVATSKRRSQAVAILELHGLLPAFEAVCGAHEDESGSAKSDVVRRALAAMHDDGGEPRPIMVGDRSHDVAGARAHGLPVVFAEWGYGDPSEGAEADWSAASPAVAVEVIRGAISSSSSPTA